MTVTELKDMGLDVNDLQLYGPDLDIQVVTVDRALANHYLTDCAFPGQRRIKDWHVLEYVAYQQKGEFKPYTVLVFNAVGDRLYMIDGYHRCHAVVKSGISQTFIIVTRRVADMEVVAHNYSLMDTGVNRTIGDMAHALDLHSKTGLSESQIKRLAGATKIITRDFRPSATAGISYTNRSRHAVEQNILEWSDEAQVYFKILKDHRLPAALWRGMNYSSTLAIALVTLRHKSAEAHAFWSSIAHYDGLRRESPEQKLVEFFLTTVQKEEGESSWLRKVATCWNYYITGKEKLEKLYARQADKPILIEGTPWKG